MLAPTSCCIIFIISAFLHFRFCAYYYDYLVRKRATGNRIWTDNGGGNGAGAGFFTTCFINRYIHDTQHDEDADDNLIHP